MKDASMLGEEKGMMEKEQVPAQENFAPNVEDTSMGSEESSMMKKEPSPMQDTPKAMMNDGDAMVKPGTYEAYAQEKLARAETGDVVLFFHASWCPTCRALSADIEKNASAVPPGVSILKVDYDSQTELKKKYGVTYQHTLVQVDKDGNLIRKWSGSSSLSSIVSQIQ